MSLNVEVLEQSFDCVKPNATQFASSFYQNLLNDYPQLRPLFANTTMEEQEKKLIMSLVLVVENLRNPGYLTTVLKQLGERHVRYGAMREHYPLVGAALLKTFESYLGTDWTPEVKQAWIDAYGVIVDIMLEGANHAEEISKLENVSKQSAEPIVTTKASTQYAANASSLDYSEQVYRSDNVSQQNTNLDIRGKAPMQSNTNKSRLNLKLLAIASLVAGLLGAGFLSYHSNFQQNNSSFKSSIAKHNIIL